QARRDPAAGGHAAHDGRPGRRRGRAHPRPVAGPRRRPPPPRARDPRNLHGALRRRKDRTVSHVFELTEANGDEILAEPTPLLIASPETWAPPCRVIAPHVEAIAATHAGRLRVASCDVDEYQLVAARFEIRAMPTLVLVDGGRVVGSIVGAVPRAKIEALI